MAQTWPVSAEGLAPDKAWQWGMLDNGLRYVIRRNALPAGHISLRFCVQVGFAHESTSERGFAHFVEHMAFNGTTHFPGGSLTAELEKHGVAIGPEINAFTFLTHTLYQIDAPSTAPADLDRWFTVLRDFADGMQFESRQIKRERGVIASEIRDRQSPGSRADTARRLFLYPLTPLSNRIEGNVDAAGRNSLRQFYDKWYRPERMILVAVGDVAPAQLEALVRRYFASLRARTPQAPEFDPGFIENPTVATTGVIHDPKVSGLSVEVTSVLPRVTMDSLEERRRWLARNLLLYMLNIRLNQVVRNNPGHLFGLTARSTIATPYSVETLISFSAPSQEWKFAIATLEQELRRSFEYTFTSDEIREARAVILTSCEQELKTSVTIKSPELAGNVLQQALWGLVSTSPEDEIRLTREWLPQIDALEMNHEWRSLWQQNRARIFGYGYFPIPNAEALLDEAFKESRRHPLNAPAKKSDLLFAYTDFGPPGRIKRHDYVPELDLHLLEFENGVRANLKRTAFEAATVHLTARFGRGMLGEPLEQPGLGAMATGTFINGALGRHPPEELRRILSASALGLSFSCQENSFAFYGQSSPATLELLLRVLGAYLTDPGWNQEAVALATARLSTYYHDLNYTPEGVIGLHAFRTLAGDDARYAAPTVAQVTARTVEELKQWLDVPLRSAPLEIGLVGDFDPEQAIMMISRTLGALPTRLPSAESVRPVTLTKQSSTHQFAFPGEANRAGIEIVWPLKNCADVKVSRRTEMLCAVFGERLRQKVRQDLGATYSPTVSFWVSEARPQDGYLMAYITVKPEETKRLTKLMIEIADNLSSQGATPDEFTQAREPILDRSRAEQKENSYWINYIIARAQSQPEVRQWPLTRVSDIQTMTLAELNALAHDVLPAPHAIVFSALPER